VLSFTDPAIVMFMFMLSFTDPDIVLSMFVLSFTDPAIVMSMFVLSFIFMSGIKATGFYCLLISNYQEGKGWDQQN
jgi:hypothetical protein